MGLWRLREFCEGDIRFSTSRCTTPGCSGAGTTSLHRPRRPQGTETSSCPGLWALAGPGSADNQCATGGTPSFPTFWALGGGCKSPQCGARCDFRRISVRVGVSCARLQAQAARVPTLVERHQRPLALSVCHPLQSHFQNDVLLPVSFGSMLSRIRPDTNLHVVPKGSHNPVHSACMAHSPPPKAALRCRPSRTPDTHLSTVCVLLVWQCGETPPLLMGSQVAPRTCATS
jgi:hypothetical protein